MPRPTEFVQQHPRAVQLAMLIIKAGIKIGAAQLGVAIPAESLHMLSSATDTLLADTLQLAIESMKSNLNEEASTRSHVNSDPINEYITNEAATAPPSDVLGATIRQRAVQDCEPQRVCTFEKRGSTNCIRWQARCGLEPHVNQETGCVAWQPV